MMKFKMKTNLKILIIALTFMALPSIGSGAVLWHSQLWVNSGNDAASLKFGADLNASDGLDNSYDVPVRFAQGQKLMVYFDHADWAASKRYFMMDIKDHGLPKEWTFYVQTTYGSLFMSWDSLEVPNTMSLELIDVLTGQSTDMMALSDYSFTSSSSSPREFKIIASGYVSGVPPIDTTEPNTSITSSIPVCNGAGDVVINYSGSDNETATNDLMYSYSINNGVWSGYGASTTHTLSSPADGNYTFAVRAKDIKGNVDSSPAEIAFSVDTTAPTLSLNTPGPATHWGSIGDRVTSNISGTGIDSGCGLQSVTYTLSDEYGVASASGTVTVDGSGNYSFDVVMETSLNSGDNQRVYTVSVEATDIIGLVTNTQKSIVINRMPDKKKRRNRSN